MKNKIYLIGFMGTGKSTVSKSIKRLTGCMEIDTDKAIVHKEGQSIPKIFEERGEEYFRTVETQILKETSEMEACVVSCGGGIILSEKNIEIMKDTGKIVWLKARPETILERVKGGNDRPLLKGHMNYEDIENMILARTDKYKAAMDFAVNTDGRSADEIAKEIILETSK